jgi:hypothetical protein
MPEKRLLGEPEDEVDGKILTAKRNSTVSSESGKGT